MQVRSFIFLGAILGVQQPGLCFQQSHQRLLRYVSGLTQVARLCPETGRVVTRLFS